MEIVNIEAKVFRMMMDKFNEFVKKVDDIFSKTEKKKLSKWLDNQDVCVILNISKRTLQTYRENGTLPYSRIGKKIYYHPKDIVKAIQQISKDK